LALTLKPFSLPFSWRRKRLALPLRLSQGLSGDEEGIQAKLFLLVISLSQPEVPLYEKEILFFPLFGTLWSGYRLFPINQLSALFPPPLFPPRLDANPRHQRI